MSRILRKQSDLALYRRLFLEVRPFWPHIAGLFALSRGAEILRVHNVPETVQAIRVWQSLAS